jgi:OmpA-OmpF porin, OOP family
VRSLMASIVVTPLIFGSLPAFAQGSPSADQIINSLKPSDNLAPGRRGIRLAVPPGDAAAPASSSPAAHQQQRVTSGRPAAMPPAADPSVSLTVNFATGSAVLTADTIRSLDELGRALSSKDLAGYRFRIEGHTDTVGSREYNHALSERRAAAVIDYIARKYGVDPAKLEAVGMGEDGLLVQTPPQTPEPRNRRVQVINVGT